MWVGGNGGKVGRAERRGRREGGRGGRRRERWSRRWKGRREEKQILPMYVARRKRKDDIQITFFCVVCRERKRRREGRKEGGREGGREGGKAHALTNNDQRDQF